MSIHLGGPFDYVFYLQIDFFRSLWIVLRTYLMIFQGLKNCHKTQLNDSYGPFG
jgi:hypothetical protein